MVAGSAVDVVIESLNVLYKLVEPRRQLALDLLFDFF
jgi:hypothetical protein